MSNNRKKDNRGQPIMIKKIIDIDDQQYEVSVRIRPINKFSILNEQDIEVIINSMDE